jgi:hypothetical protein
VSISIYKKIPIAFLRNFLKFNLFDTIFNTKKKTINSIILGNSLNSFGYLKKIIVKRNNINNKRISNDINLIILLLLFIIKIKNLKLFCSVVLANLDFN